MADEVQSRETALIADGWRVGNDGFWRNDRFGGAYGIATAYRRIGSLRGEVTGLTITPENVNETVGGALWGSYRKVTLTRMCGPFEATGPTLVPTKEGDYDLPVGWRGYIAEDADGDLYPVEESVADRTYEAV